MTQYKSSLQKFLEEQIDIINKQRIEHNQNLEPGEDRVPLLTARELAQRIKVPEATLSRWMNGEGGPRDYARVQSLAAILPNGEKLFEIMRIDTTTPLAWLTAHQRDPAVQAVLNEAYKRAMEKHDPRGKRDLAGT